jgi:hypothetical protein
VSTTVHSIIPYNIYLSTEILFPNTHTHTQKIRMFIKSRYFCCACMIQNGFPSLLIFIKNYASALPIPLWIGLVRKTRYAFQLLVCRHIQYWLLYKLVFFLSALQENLKNSDGQYFLLYITLRGLAEVAVVCVCVCIHASCRYSPFQHIRFWQGKCFMLCVVLSVTLRQPTLQI